MMPVRRLFLAGVIVALAASGCATARAKTPPEPPSLEVPAPPPRVIVPPDPEPPPPAQTPEPETPLQKPVRQKAAPRSETKTDPARGEKKVDPPPVVETATPLPPVTPPTATLQQALPATPVQVERQVRDQLKQAKVDLDRVNYQGLNSDAKSQYDTAKQFIQQAEQALKESNLVFAAKVAEKAAGLAASLVGR